MTMLRKCLTAVGALAALAWVGAVRADEPASGAASVDVPAITLQGDSEADTELVRGWHGGHGGYHGGFHGGYRGGFHGGYHGGYHGHYHSYYRPFYNSYYSYYRPYYNYGYSNYGYSNYGYSNYGYSYYPSYCSYSMPYVSYGYPASYSYASYSPYYSPYSYYPINGNGVSPAQTMPLADQAYVLPPANQVQPNGNGAPNGKYQYDGGPNSPVPVPQQDAPVPQKGVAPQPLKGYPVSITGPVQNSGLTFPAYGDTAPTPAPKTAAPASNFAFPAYGEQSKGSGFATGGTK